MTQLDERDLQQRFAALREADQAAAHGVANVVGRVPPVRRVRRVSSAAAAIACTAVLVLAIGWLRRDGKPAAQAVLISEWQASSDVLLRSARSPLLGPMPPLGASVLDRYISSTSSR